MYEPTIADYLDILEQIYKLKNEMDTKEYFNNIDIIKKILKYKLKYNFKLSSHIYMNQFPITIEKHNRFHILRDDLLPGGTKSIIADHIIQLNNDKNKFVYASPVYGGFQIALSHYCKLHNKKSIIFSAEHKKQHSNTKRCRQLGAYVVDVSPGYLSVVTHRAKQYVKDNDDACYINFGAYDSTHIKLIAERTRQVIESLGCEPTQIWCAVGSGTLVQGILEGTTTAHICGVQVGKSVTITHPRLTIFNYDKPFHYETTYPTPFPSMPNYDRKAFEIMNICLRGSPEGNILFWNVMG